MKRLAIGLLACIFLLTACQGGGNPSEFSEPDAFSSEIEDEISSEDEAESSQASSSAPATSTVQKPSSQGASSAVSSSKASSSASTSGSAQEPLVTVNVTIPEGSTFMDIANILERYGVCTKAAFYRAAQSYTVQSFTVPSSSSRCFKMEGYLFPDTYNFYKDQDPTDVLRVMLNNYAAKSGMPSDKTLILASIIEEEARSEEHMRLVSSVYHNRLNAGMRLESDPTREYVNDNITGNSLVANQGQFAALYNTYKCSGLPAGPICNPGARAIAAAQNPASSNYLYFFYGSDHTNHYSETFEEHKAQMNEYGVGN